MAPCHSGHGVYRGVARHLIPHARHLLGAKQAGRLLESSTLAAGSSWHTDAFPPTAPPALGPSCHIPELRAASASWRHMAPPASIPEARRLPVQRHRTAPGPLLPRTCSAPTPPRTFVDAPLCTACASSHLSARTSVQFPVLGVEPTYCMGSAHSHESPRYQLRHGVPEHPLFCSAVQARCGRST